MNIKRMSAIATLAAAALLMTGCMLVPGKFTSELELQRGGAFTYRYDGEIYLMAMSQLAEASARMGEDEEDEFIEQPCYEEEEWTAEDEAIEAAEEAIELNRAASVAPSFIDPEEAEAAEDAVAIEFEEYGFKERECTAEEIAEQRQDYEDRKERKRKEAEQQAQLMALLFGDLDPSNPDSADELVKRLKRQRGWKQVEHMGNGKFNVSFEISGTMGHDFVFPTFERFPMNNWIMTAAVREPRTVRIDAPGFAVQGGSGPMGGMMSGMVGVMQIFGDAEDKEKMEDFPELEGTFTIITDGRILANNTDEGPEDIEGKQRLVWDVTPRTRNAPMALIALD